MSFQSAFSPVASVYADEAVEVCNPDGTYPGLLVCDHARASLPAEYAWLGLATADLQRHIAYDIGIAPLVRALSMLLDCPAILTRQSRLLIDCNRWIRDPSSIPLVSDGISVPGNHGQTQEARAERWHRFFWPYHRTVHRMFAKVRSQHDAPIFLALHSCTRQMGGTVRDVDAGTFWHHDLRLSDRLINGLLRNGELSLRENYPYCGFGGTSFTLDYHTWGHDIPACGLEIVNDLIATPTGQATWAARLAEVLAR